MMTMMMMMMMMMLESEKLSIAENCYWSMSLTSALHQRVGPYPRCFDVELQPATTGRVQ